MIGYWGSPQRIAESAERLDGLAPGGHERFVGYGFAALEFESGDAIGLRRWPVSSIGPAYTSVWHRLRDGRWRLYADVDASYSCSRYIGQAVDQEVMTSIRLAWPTPFTLRVSVPIAALDVTVQLRSTLATTAVGIASTLVPPALLGAERVRALFERAGRKLLDEQDLQLEFGMPNGQRAHFRPRRVWEITDAKASWSGDSLGGVVPTRQIRIGQTALTVTHHFSYHAVHFTYPPAPAP